MGRLDLREILLRQPVADVEVRVLGEEAEVRQRIHLGPLELALVELGLGEDVVHLQAAHLAEQARLERQPGAPVAGLAHPREQVEHGIEARTQAPAREMSRLDAQAAVPEPQLLQQLVQPAVRAFERREVLVDERLGRAGEAAPHARLHEPEEQLVALLLVQSARCAGRGSAPSPARRSGRRTPGRGPGPAAR